MAVCGGGQRLLPKLFIHKKNLSYFERDIYLYFDPVRCISSPKYFYTHMMNHIFLHEKGFLFVLAKYSCVLFSFQMPVVPQPVIFTAYSAKDILFGSGNNKFGKGPSKTTKVSHSENIILPTQRCTL